MIDLLDLQNRQRLHDQYYHTDIDSLDLRDALHHFGEHLTKYHGRMTEAYVSAPFEPINSRILVDCFIIIMGIANRLNHSLKDTAVNDVYNDISFLPFFSILNGHRATASEKLDHLEDYDFRGEMTRAVSRLSALVVNKCEKQDIDLELEIERRWDGMESKSFLPKPRTPLKRLTTTVSA